MSLTNSFHRGSGSSATTANSRHFDRRPISSTSPPPVNDTSRRTNRLSHLPPQTHLPSNGQPRGPPSRPGSSHSQRLNNHSRSGSFLGLPQDLEQGNFSDMFSGFGEGNGRDMNGSVANPTPTIVRYVSIPEYAPRAQSLTNVGFRTYPKQTRQFMAKSIYGKDASPYGLSTTSRPRTFTTITR